MKAFGSVIMGSEDGFWFSGLRVLHLIDNEGNDYIKAEIQEPRDYATKGVRISV